MHYEGGEDRISLSLLWLVKGTSVGKMTLQRPRVFGLWMTGVPVIHYNRFRNTLLEKRISEDVTSLKWS